jgi:iron complex outermembrane receptor protein
MFTQLNLRSKVLPLVLFPGLSALLVLILLFPSSLLAGEDLFETEEEVKSEEWKKQVEKKLEEVPLKPEEYVVSGSKYAQSLREAPQAMTVLGEDDIRAYGITGLDELLRLVPGVEVKTINPADNLLGVRGLYFLTSNTVMVLVDGREVNNHFFGGVFWNLFPVTLEDIKRIEVIRGPVSAVYGANAFAGVINVITRSPQEESRARLSPQAGFYSQDFGTASGQASFSRNLGKFGVKVSADINKVQDWTDPGRESTQVRRAYFRGNYLPGGQTWIDLDGEIIRGDSRTFSYLGEVPLTGVKMDYLNLRLKHRDFLFQSNFRRLSFGLQLLSPIIPADILDQFFPLIPGAMQDFEGRLEFSRFLGNRNRFSAGANYLFNQIRSEYLVDSTQWQSRFGFFLQDEYRPREELILSAALRYDYNSATPDQTIFKSGSPADRGDLAPRLSLVYLFHSRHSLRASYSRAFRKPSFWEYGMRLTTFQSIPPLADILYSPRSLNEHINSYELGYFGQPRKNLELTACLFANQYLDALVWSPDQRTMNYGNIPSFAYSLGAEANLGFVVTPDLQGLANYSFHQIFSQSEKAKNTAVQAYPQHHANLGLRYLPRKGPIASLTLNWVSRYSDRIVDPEGNILQGLASGIQEVKQTNGNYFLVNLRAGYRFWNNRLEMGVKVFNLLNDRARQYPGVFYAPDPNQPDEEVNFGGEKPPLTVFAYARFSL